MLSLTTSARRVVLVAVLICLHLSATWAMASPTLTLTASLDRSRISTTSVGRTATITAHPPEPAAPTPVPPPAVPFDLSARPYVVQEPPLNLPVPQPRSLEPYPVALPDGRIAVVSVAFSTTQSRSAIRIDGLAKKPPSATLTEGSFISPPSGLVLVASGQAVAAAAISAEHLAVVAVLDQVNTAGTSKGRHVYGWILSLVDGSVVVNATRVSTVPLPPGEIDAFVEVKPIGGTEGSFILAYFSAVRLPEYALQLSRQEHKNVDGKLTTLWEKTVTSDADHSTARWSRPIAALGLLPDGAVLVGTTPHTHETIRGIHRVLHLTLHGAESGALRQSVVLTDVMSEPIWNANFEPTVHLCGSPSSNRVRFGFYVELQSLTLSNNRASTFKPRVIAAQIETTTGVLQMEWIHDLDRIEVFAPTGNAGEHSRFGMVCFGDRGVVVASMAQEVTRGFPTVLLDRILPNGTRFGPRLGKAQESSTPKFVTGGVHSSSQDGWFVTVEKTHSGTAQLVQWSQRSFVGGLSGGPSLVEAYIPPVVPTLPPTTQSPSSSSTPRPPSQPWSPGSGAPRGSSGNQARNDDSSGLSDEGIIGVVVGVSAAVCLAVGVGYFACTRTGSQESAGRQPLPPRPGMDLYDDEAHVKGFEAVPRPGSQV